MAWQGEGRDRSGVRFRLAHAQRALGTALGTALQCKPQEQLPSAWGRLSLSFCLTASKASRASRANRDPRSPGPPTTLVL
mmetsp:Transcript_73052/g.158553  ORF Transcript_73052/g.158553 Transcript_73052/m.158553 type:complete len:80 (-) Transcript_73052:489-728(-)